MPDQFNQSQQDYSTYQRPKQNGFASAALLMGIIAFFTVLLVLPPLVIAPLGIIFAVLSKGSERKIPMIGKVSIGVCVTAFFISIFITVSSFMHLLPNLNKDVLYDYQKKLSEGVVSEEDLLHLYENLYTPAD